VTRQETIAAYLSNRFRSTLRGAQPGFDDPLISAGIVDSFGVLEVMAFLEDTFGIVIDPARHELTDFETVNGIADLVEKAPRRS
jgi:acyl carrier protein